MTQQMGYEQIIDRIWDDIPKPQFLPDGSWRYRCTSAKVMPPKSEDGDTRVLFVMEPQEPMDDVDQHALDALGANYDYSENVVFVTIWLSKSQDYAKVRNILTKMGVTTAGKTIKDSVAEAKAREFVGYTTLGTRTNKATGALITENIITTYAELN
jgi:hypothetical protein